MQIYVDTWLSLEPMNFADWLTATQIKYLPNKSRNFDKESYYGHKEHVLQTTTQPYIINGFDCSVFLFQTANDSLNMMRIPCDVNFTNSIAICELSINTYKEEKHATIKSINRSHELY